MDYIPAHREELWEPIGEVVVEFRRSDGFAGIVSLRDEAGVGFSMVFGGYGTILRRPGAVR